MKIKALIISVSFLICFPSLGFAKDELVMHQELMWWQINGQSGDSACFQLIYIEIGRDVPDMRDELLDAQCGLTDGKYSLTLTGAPGTTVTFFGKYNFKKGNGFLTIRKKDDQKLWLLDLTDFPAGQWHTSEATDDSGAFESFYNPSPMFEQQVSSIKWGEYVDEGS
tara:strand:+ start:357 stop:857 length:501 start_codon:yes stop_codon:yes gene_type:complete